MGVLYIFLVLDIRCLSFKNRLTSLEMYIKLRGIESIYFFLRTVRRLSLLLVTLLLSTSTDEINLNTGVALQVN